MSHPFAFEMRDRGPRFITPGLRLAGVFTLPAGRHLVTPALLLLFLSGSLCGDGLWPLERPSGMPVIQSLEVMCGKDHMDVHLSFSQPFEGIVSSKGQHGDPRCIYVPPSTGKTFFSFRIAYARCGTKPDLHGQFYENTVVVQYDKDLLEVWDEAKRLRCEWFNDYEKTASKPPMVIADLDVIQLDFRGDNVDCWMEIQHGKGPWAPPVSGIVPLGSTLTLVVAINDYRGEFDMRVKSCAASDGAGHVIDLSDEFGCVLRPKMISRFLKAKAADERASVITYAFFHAFKFPDALSVHVKCKVEICRHGCLDHCQLTPGAAHLGALDRKDTQLVVDHDTSQSQGSKYSEESNDILADGNTSSESDLLYDEVLDDGSEGGQGEGMEREEQGQMPPRAALSAPPPQAVKTEHRDHRDHHDHKMDADELVDLLTRPFVEQSMALHRDGLERFPHGPRNFAESDSEITAEAAPMPAVAGPRSLRRRRRTALVPEGDRRTRSADVGVSGIYEVISEADLAFSPDSKGEAVTVFQGRIREEVVYGICLPVPGFSALFALVAVSAVAAALVAGSLLYRYQVQKERHVARASRISQSSRDSGAMAMNSLASWMALRLLGSRQATDSPSGVKRQAGPQRDG